MNLCPFCDGDPCTCGNKRASVLSLTRQGPASYYCAEPVAVATWLVEQGYRSEDPRSPHEYLRFRKAKSLIIVYHNGTVLLQGADVTSAHKLLSGLVETITEPLPF